MKKINKNSYKIHLVKISALINLKKLEECKNYIESIFETDLQEEEFIFFESILEILNISKEIKTNFYKNIESIENRIKKINENIEKLQEYDKTLEKEFLQDLVNTLFMINDYKLMRFFINWQSFL